MKIKILLIIMLFLVTINNAQEIDQITSITFNKDLVNNTLYGKYLINYEDRLIAEANGLIEEFIITESSDLERLSIFSTGSVVFNPIIDGDRLYTFHINNNNSVVENNMNIFDLSTTPMSLIGNIQIPTNFPIYFYGDMAFNMGDYILLNDNEATTFKFNKSSFIFEEPIYGMGGIYTVQDSMFIQVYTSIEDNERMLAFYDYSMGYLELVNMLSIGYDQVERIKAIDNLLYITGWNFVYVFDISDLNEIYQLISIYSSGLIYDDVLICEDYLICSTFSGFRVYNISDVENPELIISNSNIAQQMCIIDDKLYYTNGFIIILDILNNFNTIKEYGGNVNNFKFIAPYLMVNNFGSSEYRLFNVLDDNPIILVIDTLLEPGSFYISDFEVSDEYVFTITTLSNTYPFANYLDIYSVHTGGLIYRYFYSAPYAYINLYGDYIVISAQERLMPNNNCMIYRFQDGYLEVIGEYIGSNSWKTEYKHPSFFISTTSNLVYFHDNLDPFNVNIEPISFNPDLSRMVYQDIINFRAINYTNRRTDNYFFNSDQLNFISLYNLSHDYQQNTTIYNSFFSLNGYAITNITKYYDINESELRLIGELEFPGLQVHGSYLYPNQNKLIIFTVYPYTCYLYDLEYTTHVTESEEVLPILKNNLFANYPNPFNPTTTISFNNAIAGDVVISVYNVKGQKVKTLVDGFYEVGRHNITWNGDDDKGKRVSSGLYFYRMKANDVVETKKMMLIK